MTANDSELRADVLTVIHRWSSDKPNWQRDALRRIIQYGYLDDQEIGELVDIARASGKSCDGSVGQPLSQAHFAIAPINNKSASLTAISNVIGVNNIAPNQRLEFQDKGLNVIYGDNGTGKSGYARIFKRACRSRRAQNILPNVYDAHTAGPARAKIEFSVNGTVDTVEWVDNNTPNSLLGTISVFDSDCASVHVTGKNEVAFKPFGLDIPDELARACQTIKDILNKQKSVLESQRNSIFSKPSWSQDTTAGRALQALSWRSSISTFETLAELTPSEMRRLDALRDDLNKDPKIAEAQQRLKARNAVSLLDIMRRRADINSDKKIRDVKLAHEIAYQKREAAKLIATGTFSEGYLPKTGEAAWRSMWEAATKYHAMINLKDQKFRPVEGDKCPLCQTNLDKSAEDRFSTFIKFMETDAENSASEAEDIYKQLYRSLRGSQLSLEGISSFITEISIDNPHLAKSVRRLAAFIRHKRKLLDRSIIEKSDLLLPQSTNEALPALHRYCKEKTQYADELLKAIDREGRRKLELEYVQLRDRKFIHDNMGIIREELARLKEISEIEVCIQTTATTSITKLGNDIADQIITPQLRDRFQSEIIKIAGDKVRVEIIRSGGRYGSPQYQIKLFAKPNAQVGEVLSEGEQTCVAVAAFFAELATAEHRSSLIFDDPVTSLDHRWRRQVAQRLVAEAKERQIIVFAHDLVFVNDLQDMSHEENIDCKLMSVSRGKIGSGIIVEGLPWKAQRVPERLDNLEKNARAAKRLYDEDDEIGYAAAIGNVYGDLRATWERALEDVAFFRVIMRHRDYIETRNLKKVSVLSEADCDTFAAGFKKCCDIIDAHDPSRGRNASAPNPSDVLKDIEQLKKWVQSIKDRQKIFDKS